MSLFHRHHWTETGRAFVPPREWTLPRPDGAKRAEEAINDIIFGATFLSLRCTGCGDVMTRKLVGKFVDAEARQ